METLRWVGLVVVLVSGCSGGDDGPMTRREEAEVLGSANCHALARCTAREESPADLDNCVSGYVANVCQLAGDCDVVSPHTAASVDACVAALDAVSSCDLGALTPDECDDIL